jgi:hypothetical protein
MATETCGRCGVGWVPGDRFCGACGREQIPDRKADRAPGGEPAPEPRPPANRSTGFWLIASVAILAVGLLWTNAAKEIEAILVYSVFLVGPALATLAAVRPLRWLLAAVVAGLHQFLILASVPLRDPYVSEEPMTVLLFATFATAGAAAAASANCAVMAANQRGDPTPGAGTPADPAPARNAASSASRAAAIRDTRGSRRGRDSTTSRPSRARTSALQTISAGCVARSVPVETFEPSSAPSTRRANSRRRSGQSGK